MSMKRVKQVPDTVGSRKQLIMSQLYSHLPTAKSKVYGLLGNNISYSLSPEIHNFSSRLLGRDSVYLAFNLGAQHLATFLEAAWSMDFGGFNVTQPYKNDVARIIGAKEESVNTVYRGPDGWLGLSTDGRGFLAACNRAGIQVATLKEIIFLGTGGANQSILQSLLTQTKLKKLTFMRRSPKHDDRIRRATSLPTEFTEWSSDIFRDLVNQADEASLIIQGTSAPQNGDNLSGFKAALEGFRGSLVDICYGNHLSSLFHHARQKGLKVMDGLPMLIEQALLSQKLWWGNSAPYGQILELIKSKKDD